LILNIFFQKKYNLILNNNKMTECITEEQQLKNLKSELKRWEHSFLKNEGHKPTKLDISNNKEIGIIIFF